VQSS
jgi:hypothetical protein